MKAGEKRDVTARAFVERVKVPGECSFGPGWVAPEGGIQTDRWAEPKTHVNGSTDLSPRDSHVKR